LLCCVGVLSHSSALHADCFILAIGLIIGSLTCGGSLDVCAISAVTASIAPMDPILL
jgi:hypothetical protein